MVIIILVKENSYAVFVCKNMFLTFFMLVKKQENTSPSTKQPSSLAPEALVSLATTTRAGDDRSILYFVAISW